MQRYAGTYSPEQLHIMQKIFDLIWMEFQSSGSSRYTGPVEPDALREEIARRVFGQFDGDAPNADNIVGRVLSSFGVPV
jgi:hypothetical protein